MIAVSEDAVNVWIEEGRQPHVPRFVPLVAATHQITGAEISRLDVAKVAMSAGSASSVPLAAALFHQIGWPQAFSVIVGLAFFKTVGSLLAKSSVFNTAKQSVYTQSFLQRLTELLDETEIKNHSEVGVQAERNGKFIQATLSIVETLMLSYTGAPKGSITVTFARYRADCTELEILHRNRGSLRILKTIPATDSILGHRLCLARKPERVINDLHHFPEKYRKSPTGSLAGYRSFFILPMYRKDDPLQEPIGFVAIDSNTPYTFFGNRATLISAAIAPLISEITVRL